MDQIEWKGWIFCEKGEYISDKDIKFKQNDVLHYIGRF